MEQGVVFASRTWEVFQAFERVSRSHARRYAFGGACTIPFFPVILEAMRDAGRDRS